MKHGSLFSGIGGFDLAAQWMGWTNVFQVEIDPFCQRVLEKNFPNTKRYGDIKEFDGTKYRGAIDVLSGGFPCQPFSTAGKRKGTKDDRYLWPEMLRVIREVQPSYVLGENVYGLVNWSGGLVFEQVCSDLENEGYQVQPVILPACAVNAPHRRDRVWFIAYAGSYGHERRGLGEDRSAESQSESEGNQWQRLRDHVERIGAAGIIANTDGSKRREGGGNEEESETPERHVSSCDSWHVQSYWQDFPTQPPLRDGDDGIPSRLVRSAIEAGGNAVVPALVFEIFKAIESINQRGGR